MTLRTHCSHSREIAATESDWEPMSPTPKTGAEDVAGRPNKTAEASASTNASEEARWRRFQFIRLKMPALAGPSTAESPGRIITGMPRFAPAPSVNLRTPGEVVPQAFAGEGKFIQCRRISCQLNVIAQPATTIIQTVITGRGAPVPNQMMTPSRTSNSESASQRAARRRSALWLGGATKNRDSEPATGTWRVEARPKPISRVATTPHLVWPRLDQAESDLNVRIFGAIRSSCERSLTGLDPLGLCVLLVAVALAGCFAEDSDERADERPRVTVFACMSDRVFDRPFGIRSRQDSSAKFGEHLWVALVRR